jgi:hypothetical protein
VKNYTVKRYCSDDFALWNDFVSQSSNAPFLFDRKFMEYHADRFEDYSLLIFEDTTLQAILPANSVGKQLYSHQGLTYGGFVFTDEITVDNISKIIFETLVFLKKESFELLQINEILPFYAPGHFSIVRDCLQMQQAKIVGNKTDLAIDFKANYSISKIKLRHYRKMQSHNLVVKKESDFKDFWQKVLEPLLAQKYQTKPIHSLSEISLLQSRFPSNIEQYNLYHEEEILAGITIFKTEKVIKSQYCATTEAGKKFRALDYLYLYLTELHQDKYDFFDMGTVNDNSELGYNEGLLNQKKELGCSVYFQNIFQIAL